MITRIAVALLLASATALSEQARAQAPSPRSDPTPREIQQVEDCLGRTQPKKERRRCIGIVADACIAAPGRSTTFGMTVCRDREVKIWKKLLSRFAEATAQASSPEQRRYLAGAQQAWQRAARKLCDWPHRFFEGGTIAGPLGVECLMEQTALRAVDLLEMKEWAEPH